MLDKLKMNGAEVLAQAFVENDIRVVFGIPGVSNLPLFEALRRAGVRIIATTHEQGSAFMAYGVGRTTEKPGVFITIPGPGFTNAMTPIAEALVDSTPMFGIVTCAPLSGKNFQMHELDQTQLAKPVVKSSFTAQRVSELPTAFKTLFHQTITGEPGPCILQIPANLYWDRLDHREREEDKSSENAFSPEEQIAQAVQRVQSARRVGLIAGMGAVSAALQLRELAEWLNAPVFTTGSGRGVIDEAHPLSLMFGWGDESLGAANRVLSTCDLILAIGVKFSQTGTHDFRLNINMPLIHVDASAKSLDANYKAEISLHIDAGEFFARVLEQKRTFGPRRDDELISLIHTEREKCVAQLKDDTSARLSIGDASFSPAEFFGKLRDALPPDAILVTDAGFNERLTLNHWRVSAPRTLINPSDYEAMGFAVPVAIGAAIAHPERQVVAITGDGGLVMSGLELMTAVREKVKLTVIVLNNEGFGVIKQIQEATFGKSVAVEVGAPDFHLLAQSIRMNFQNPTGGFAALEEALHHPSPTLLEVKMTHPNGDAWSKLQRRIRNDVKQAAQKLLARNK